MCCCSDGRGTESKLFGGRVGGRLSPQCDPGNVAATTAAAPTETTAVVAANSCQKGLRTAVSA